MFEDAKIPNRKHHSLTHIQGHRSV